ncbi:hypothetical protein B0T21DRAFT_113211 [Apiosordaria backusii]|uniref:Uncharacterized protein n=1 Tax=Apiosordaria backusii TaxID=314023 RepID=A0AA39ZQ03_9PEZI|nr:hypothetical protein B0T21DRAFT_113211 [Apiosordaria backusii]
MRAARRSVMGDSRFDVSESVGRRERRRDGVRLGGVDACAASNDGSAAGPSRGCECGEAVLAAVPGPPLWDLRVGSGTLSGSSLRRRAASCCLLVANAVTQLRECLEDRGPCSVNEVRCQPDEISKREKTVGRWTASVQSGQSKSRSSAQSMCGDCVQLLPSFASSTFLAQKKDPSVLTLAASGGESRNFLAQCIPLAAKKQPLSDRQTC